jgi:hypothetical protein
MEIIWKKRKWGGGFLSKIILYNARQTVIVYIETNNRNRGIIIR